MTDIACDVLIIGSGIGGLTATIRAKLAGMRPLLLEKQSLIGGSSALSGGVLWLPDNRFMRRDGIPDSRENALTYLANFAGADDPGSTQARREAYVDAVAPLVDMFEKQGVPLRRCDGYPDYYDTLSGGVAAGRAVETEVFDANRLGEWKHKFQAQNFPLPARASESAKIMLMAVNWAGRRKVVEVGLRGLKSKLLGRSIRSGGAALQGHLLELALRLGCDIRTNAALVDLVSEAGRITGAEVNIEGRSETVRASRGVVITAGGFAHNIAMRQKYQKPPVSTEWSLANFGDTGESLQAMAKAGAALGWMDEAWWVMGFMSDAPAGSNQTVTELHKPHAILVDASGQRFTNEGESYMATGRACYERNKTVGAIPAWVIMDARHRKRYIFGFAPPGRIPKAWIERDFVKQDATLAGLANQCGIDPQGLESTVTRWNEMCQQGVDLDFSKGESAYNRYFGDPSYKNPCMGPIAQPPFWAAPIYPGDVGTCGGAITDEHARVKRPDGSAIEGLYAAGNCTSPLAGPYYCGPGLSIGCSSIFGMLAVDHIAS